MNMKKIFLFLLSSILLFVLSGCSTELSANATKDKKIVEKKQTEPDIVGYVMNKDGGRALIVSTEPQNFSLTGGKEEFYNAIWTTYFPNEIEVGRKVQVWLKGPILESFPAQGTAKKVIPFPRNKPTGATLFEDEAISKALAENAKKIDGFFFPVIKAIKYDESSATWQILIKDSESDSEINLKIK